LRLAFPENIPKKSEDHDFFHFGDLTHWLGLKPLAAMRPLLFEEGAQPFASAMISPL